MVKAALIIGCGYLGTALAQLWTAQGLDVTVTTTRPERLQELQSVAAKAIVLQGNNLSLLQELLQDVDCVVLSVAAKSTDAYTTTYLESSKTLVEALQSAPNVVSVVYTGSTSVYGDSSGDWVDESTPLQPSTLQAQILANTEDILLSATSPNRAVCILRLGEIVGPGRSIKARVQQNAGKTLAGTGQNYTNLSHRDDIIGAIDFVAKSKLSGIYNLCGDLHIPRKDYYDRICDLEGWPRVNWDPSMRTVHGGNKRVSSDKIHQAGYVEYSHSWMD